MMRFDGRGVDEATLAAMTDTLIHRGPDDAGTWIGATVGFGHRRLSIIDPVGSSQPMSTPDGRYRVVFNGEIFNYRELRAEFGLGHRTNGDTEVFLGLFARRGLDAFSLLRGQFAAAIYDELKGQTVLVRDRMGVLPLVYHLDGSKLVFASENKALVPVLGPPQLDPLALEQYLRRRWVPAPRTLSIGIKKLPPGHALVIERDGSSSLVGYWHLPAPEECFNVPPGAAVDLVDAALQLAVADSMIADVPVGSFLSGGVDSSLIVAMASRIAGGELHTFSAAFGDARYDETEYARLVSELFGTTHHEVSVRTEDFLDLWPLLTAHRDAPLGEAADVAVYRLAELARGHVKVTLSGEGSDELFGGYPKYLLANVCQRAGAIPHRFRGPLLRRVDASLPAHSTRAKIAARALGEPGLADRAVGWFAPFTQYEVSRLVGRQPMPEPKVPDAVDAVDLMARMDIATWLPDNLLERADRMSMAASLETRPPFLDHRVVELAMRLPSRVKVHRGQRKWVVKKVAERYLPTDITERPKIGFKVPLDAWFRTGLRDVSRDLLLSSDSLTSTHMDRSMVQKLLDDHDTGHRNEEQRLWTLLSLEQWARTCLHP